MNFNSDFDLKKAKSFLLTENVEDYGTNALTGKPLPKPDPVVENEEEFRMGIFDDIDKDLEYEEDRIGYLDAIIKYCTKEMEDIGNDNGGLDDTESLDERFADKIADVNPLTGEKERVIYETEELDEMAKISGDLKSAIEKVLDANKDLEGLSLKKAIKGDAAVIDALDGEDLYDNQLNKFIALSKGERTLGQRGRKADPNKPSTEPKTKTDKPTSQKLKITNPKADEKPVSTVFGSEENDAEDIADEMAATRAAKGNKRLGTSAEKLAQITKEMKALVPAYQAAKGTPKEAAIVAQLKALTAEKKSLEAKVYKEPKALSAADLMGGEEV
jgi:hypothetical protein